jgi:hypothetical protein
LIDVVLITIATMRRVSMEVVLARIDPAWCDAFRADPWLVRALFWEDGPPLPGPFNHRRDTYEEDYRMLADLVERYAKVARIAQKRTAMSMAVEPTGSNLGFDFTYGDATLLSGEQVTQIADALGRELATLPAPRPDRFDDESDPDVIRYMYRECLVEVEKFYRTAAKRGCAIIAGVN